MSNQLYMKNDLNPSEVLEPLLMCSIPLSEQRLRLSQMFALAVSNSPDNETENFTAKNLTPVFLALLETLENLQNSNLNENP